MSMSDVFAPKPEIVDPTRYKPHLETDRCWCSKKFCKGRKLLKAQRCKTIENVLELHGTSPAKAPFCCSTFRASVDNPETFPTSAMTECPTWSRHGDWTEQCASQIPRLAPRSSRTGSVGRSSVNAGADGSCGGSFDR